MTRVAACPSPERLRALLDGLASDFEADALTAHLDACADCRNTLEALVGDGESAASLASKLRLEPGEVSPALAAVLDGLRPEAATAAHVHEPSQGDGPTVGTLPRRVGPYRVEGLIGVGGMGRVLKAFDPNLRRVVALKVMADPLAANATARSRFKREARAAAAIAHDHVVTIHEIEEQNGVPYIVMQFVQGKSLQERIDESGALGLREVLRIGSQIAAGLAAAHAQGIVHRDVKPSNILLENGVERVKLTDFGLARVNDDLGETVSGVIAGTPQYMSPEQAKGEALDQRSDLFSFGAVLYAMCTGEPPFRGGHPLSILKRVCEEEPRPPRQVNPEVPEWLAAIIGKLMAKEPAQRFQSAEEIGDLLAQHLAHLQQPTSVAMPAPITAPTRPAANRPRMWHRQLLALLGVAALTAFLASSIWRKELDEEWPAALIGVGILALLVWRWGGRSAHTEESGQARPSWNPPHWLFVAGFVAVAGSAVSLAMGKRVMRDVFGVTWPLMIIAGIAAVTMILSWAFHRDRQRRGAHGGGTGWLAWAAFGILLAAGLATLGVVREHREELFWRGPKDKGMLSINVSDPKVKVVIEGGTLGRREFDGANPISDYLAPGQYTVTAFKDGEILQQEFHTVTARRAWYVYIATVGSVRFLPVDVEFKVDGNLLTSQELGRLPVGKHKWEASKDGTVVNRGEFFLHGDEHLIISIDKPKAELERSRADQIELARAAVEHNEKFLADTRARFQGGSISGIDLRAAEILLLESKIQLAKAEGKAVETVNLLRDLVKKRQADVETVELLIEVGRERPLARAAVEQKLKETQADLRAAEKAAGLKKKE